MTGFGRSDYRDDRINISVEIKTVNHRFRDFFIKIPRTLGANEEKIRRCISDVLARGRIEVYIKFDRLGTENKSVKLDSGLASAYIDVLHQLADEHPDVSDNITLSLMSRFPDVITLEDEQPDDDADWIVLEPVLKQALVQVAEVRAREGAALRADMMMHCDMIAAKREAIAALAPEMLIDYQTGLKTRVQELLGDAAVDEQRLLTEVAVMADKLAIDEELTRLETHIAALKALLDIDHEPVGRKMDFLIQELNREINTIGSKANDVRISNLVVDVKSEIEKIREQVQNIE